MSGMSAHSLATLYQAFKEAPAVAERELLATMMEATTLLEREVKEYIPRGATGLTAASVTSDAFSSPAGVLGVVGSSQPAAVFIELGTKPHMPPVEPLIPWVKSVMGLREKEAKAVAFLIARKISRVGTKAQAPFKRALEDCGPAIDRMFEGAAARLAEHLAGGVA